MGYNRADVLDIQRKINSTGSMRTLCILSVDALKKTINERLDEDNSVLSIPSVILVDYEMAAEEKELLKLLKNHSKLAGVPLFFVVEAGNEGAEEKCYIQGAMVVLQKPITQSGVIRVERAARQYEVTKKYERILQKQVSDLQAAKEIHRLNQQLESRNEFLYRIFGKYFSDDVLDVILKKPEGALIGGDKRELAVMMADLRGFSSLAEEMNADDMTDLLNMFFGTIVEIILQYDGTVIEYMGDGILAVFGAPVKSVDFRGSAIAAGIAMQNAMWDINSYCAQKGYETLEMGIGIHCGEVFVGNVGSERMMRYNVLGRAVNECSRIEGYSVGGQVLVSQEMLEKISCDVQITDKRVISAKGIRKPLRICEVAGIGGKYDCYLEGTNNNVVYLLTEGKVLQLYLIDNKLVAEKPVMVRLKEISTKSAMVEALIEEELPEIYSDVEVRMCEDDGNSVFTGVYAKVIKQQNGEAELHFTHINKDFERFIHNIKHKVKAGIIVMNERNVSKMKLREAPVENMHEILFSMCAQDDKCVLVWSKDGDDIKLLFASNDSEIRALEFMDYLVSDYGMAKGDGELAEAVISGTFLQVLMSEADMQDIGEYLKKKIDLYYTECNWIYAKHYVEENHEKILHLPKYIKKNVSWAYVKTTDIVNVGEKFKLKSLENESDIIMTASEDLYVMIGCRGEIYSIERDKFEKTYEATDDMLDIYEQMLDFLPEVKLYPQGGYVSLDDKAHLCHPKNGSGIYVVPLEQRTKVFTPHNKGEYFVGRKGDFLAIREDDFLDMYIIQQEIFYQTYEPADS